MSPIYFVHTNPPRILIIHGKSDKLVPIQQPRSFLQRWGGAGSRTNLFEREGKEHGWAELAKDVEIFADWFDEHLRGLKPAKN